MGALAELTTLRWMVRASHHPHPSTRFRFWDAQAPAALDQGVDEALVGVVAPDANRDFPIWSGPLDRR
jgi:hypothetical protein